MGLPVKSKPTWLYLPLISMWSLLWWITGMAVWVHFTIEVQNHALNVFDILDVSLSAGVGTQAIRLINSLQATCVIFALLAICIHALGIWRGIVTERQDKSGVVEDKEGFGFVARWMSLLLLGAWWLLVIWMLILILEFGAGAALVYVIHKQLTNHLILQTVFANNPSLSPITGYCPTTCLNTASTGIYLFVDGLTLTTTLPQICICNPADILAAAKEGEDAWAAAGGMMAGLLIMSVYAVGLLAYLHHLRATMTLEQDTYELIEQQGAGDGHGKASSGSKLGSGDNKGVPGLKHNAGGGKGSPEVKSSGAMATTRGPPAVSPQSAPSARTSSGGGRWQPPTSRQQPYKKAASSDDDDEEV